MNVPFDNTYRRVALLILTLLAGIIGWLMVRPFMNGVLIAGVLAILVAPLYKKWAVKRSENMAATGVVLFVILVLVIPTGFIGALLVQQMKSAQVALETEAPDPTKTRIEQILTGVDAKLNPVLENYHVKIDSNAWLQTKSSEIQKAAVSFVTAFGQGLFSLIVALLTLFFLVRDGHRLREPFVEMMPFPPNDTNELIRRVENTVRSVFVGVILVSLVQGAIAGVTYLFTGVPSPIIWWIATTILCMVPLLGAPIVYVPMALLLFAEDKIVNGIILLVVGFGIVSQIDNVLRPFVIGARANLHPMGIFFSLLGGIFLFGPIGLMVGPIVLTTLVFLQEYLRRERKTIEAATAT